MYYMMIKTLLFTFFLTIATVYAFQSKGQAARSKGQAARNIVSNREIKELSLELWNLDNNHANNVTINAQENLNYGDNVDRSFQPFFTYVDPEILEQPTFRSLIALLDNYERQQGRREVVTQQERDEVNQFLDQVLATNVGRRLYDFMNSKGLAGSGGLSGFKHMLHTIWFQTFSRMNRVHDSCGFEHVFVGEVKYNKVSGFHNWVQLYLEEQSGNLNYHGYVHKRKPNIFGARFQWDNYMKPLSGVMIGKSPELELALITLCHVTRPNRKCYVKLDHRGRPVTVPIQTWEWSHGSAPRNGQKSISSGYFKV